MLGWWRKFMQEIQNVYSDIIAGKYYTQKCKLLPLHSVLGIFLETWHGILARLSITGQNPVVM